MADPQKLTEPVKMAAAVGAPARPATEADPAPGGEQSAFRAEITEQLMAMARFLMANDSRDPVGDSARTVLGALDRDEALALEDLVAAHNDLKLLVAPATPAALVAKAGRQGGRREGRFLGPNTVVRNLAVTNLLFLAVFLGISLSPDINDQSINKSIYDDSGFPLFLKLCFLISAAGLGASFGALFDLWDEIKTNRFDPTAESVHWMKISLGVVAGIALTEIFSAQDQAALASSQDGGPALIALIGGFSAGLLHVALSRMVNAIKSIFAPPES